MAARAEATNFISLLVSIWIVGLLQQARAEIKVASFLIDEFTDRKYETELELDWVKDVIIKVICRYDVIFVMGLTERDFVSAFTDALNEYANLSESKVYCRNKEYSFKISPKFGDLNCKDAFVYFYSPQMVELEDVQLYSGPNSDKFQRPPFVAKLTYPPAADARVFAKGYVSVQYELTLIGFQASSAKNVTFTELNYLPSVYDYYHENGWPDAYFLGDFSADCKYLDMHEFEMLNFSKNATYRWLIEQSTNIDAFKDHCQYDKFVAAGETAMACYDQDRPAKVFNFNKFVKENNKILDYIQNKREILASVSTHYPIYMEIECAIGLATKQQQTELLPDQPSKTDKYISQFDLGRSGLLIKKKMKFKFPRINFPGFE